MSRVRTFEHRFVASAPRELEQGILYVSVEFATALHHCACGCGLKVVTPFSPNDWSMTFDGKTVSLSPSIGNWSLPCRSHYFIRQGRIKWADDWSNKQIQFNREQDRSRKRPKVERVNSPQKVQQSMSLNESWIGRLWRKFSSRL